MLDTRPPSGLPGFTRLAVHYGLTIFLSAFLLFQVQPIMGKLILPWFGGSASVWTTCMLFFQLLLLGGYLYCHWVVGALSPRQQSLLHMALLLLACLALPIMPDPEWKPLGDEDPILRILGLLAASVGLPYFVLSTTGPLLQAWFARERPGVVPYRLFALSNLGSMTALLGYPVLVEPGFTAGAQSVGWSWGFAFFALLCASLAWRSAKAPATSTGEVQGADAEPSPTPASMALWVILAACPSMLLLAITSHLTLNVAPVPLLWVVPLALYLLSFILSFEHPRWYWRNSYGLLLMLGLAALAWLPMIPLGAMDIRLRVVIYLLALFAFCMVSHGELVRLRPHPRHLTAFYLMISVGGALGGLFVGLAAPKLFISDLELPISIVTMGAVFFVVRLREPGVSLGPLSRKSLTYLAAVAAITLAIASAYDQYDRITTAVASGRNFYGALRVSDAGSGLDARRTLSHGRIVHGEQIADPERHRWPTTYYGPGSGVGQALAIAGRKGPIHVGLVGLGAGTLVTYGRPGDRYRVYEINAMVVDFARRYFRFLGESEAGLRVVLGDGRLALERDPPQGFDVLVVDAFSGDAVPSHLLTQEAFALYARHLAPEGLMAIHVSNRFLDLPPIVLLSAKAQGLAAVQLENEADYGRGVFSSTWMLVARNAAQLDQPEFRALVQETPLPPHIRSWTDNYNSLVPILK